MRGIFKMTPAEAAIHNRAIAMAVKAYPQGIGAIKAMTAKQAVIVEHIGRSTKQEIVDVADAD